MHSFGYCLDFFTRIAFAQVGRRVPLRSRDSLAYPRIRARGLAPRSWEASQAALVKTGCTPSAMKSSVELDGS